MPSTYKTLVVDGTTPISQYKALKHTGITNGQPTGDVCGANDAAFFGIADEKITLLNQHVSCCIFGPEQYALAGGAWTAGDPLATDSSGRLVVAAGTYSTNLTGATNNDLVYTVKDAYRGRNIKIAYVDPGGATYTGNVQVFGDTITVYLSRSGSAVSETGASVKALIDADPVASLMVTVANKAANDGTGLLAALTAQELTPWRVCARAQDSVGAANEIGRVIVGKEWN